MRDEFGGSTYIAPEVEPEVEDILPADDPAIPDVEEDVLDNDTPEPTDNAPLVDDGPQPTAQEMKEYMSLFLLDEDDEDE